VLMICHEHAHLPRQSHKVRLHIWQVAGRFFDGWLDETKWRQKKELSLASVHMYCTALKFGLWINHSPPPVTTVYYNHMHYLCISYPHGPRVVTCDCNWNVSTSSWHKNGGFTNKRDERGRPMCPPEYIICPIKGFIFIA
jgi:hypothetical protein